MQPKDIQAEIHIIQTQLQAIKSDSAETHLQADTIEQALEAVRARCERIRDHVAVPLRTGEVSLPLPPADAKPGMADVQQPAV